MDKIEYLKQQIGALAPYSLHSRVHPLKTFNTAAATCYVKRDDELGFGISGSKIRKYASLIPDLLKRGIKEAIVIGGAYSNNVVGITQLLIENAIKPVLFLLGDETLQAKGNLLLASLLVPAEHIHWIARKDWPQVALLAADYVKNKTYPVMVIPEGACMSEALPGALTLPLDILQNECEQQQEFQHIFMDAGTGLSAIATIFAFAWLNKKTLIHVLLLADDEKSFLAKLKQFQLSFEQMMQIELDWSLILAQFKLHKPTQARSFGAVNATVINFIKKLAREAGFFTDPVYSAKLFLAAKNIIKVQALAGNVLIIHSGGALSLMGFQAQLAKMQ